MEYKFINERMNTSKIRVGVKVLLQLPCPPVTPPPKEFWITSNSPSSYWWFSGFYIMWGDSTDNGLLWDRRRQTAIVGGGTSILLGTRLPNCLVSYGWALPKTGAGDGKRDKTWLWTCFPLLQQKQEGKWSEILTVEMVWNPHSSTQKQFRG